MLFKAVIAAGAIWLAYLARDQFPAFVVGMIIAYVLSRPVSFLCHHTRISRGMAVLLIYVLALCGIGIAVWKGWPALAEQATSLFENRQVIVTSLIKQISETTGWSPDIAAVASQILDKAGTFITSQPEEILAVGGLVSRSLLFIVIALVSSIYFLKDAQEIGAFCLRFVPENQRATSTEVGRAINHKFSKYIGGQFLLMGIMAVLIYAILTFYHLNYALIVALVAGIAEIIPFFGPVLALGLAAIIAASQLGLSGALPVFAFLFGARMLQDYLIIPRVIGHAMKLHPLVTLFFVMAGDAIDGGLGMVLGVPAAAAANVLVDHFYPVATDPSGTTSSVSSKTKIQLRAISSDAARLIRQIKDWLVAWIKSMGGK